MLWRSNNYASFLVFIMMSKYRSIFQELACYTSLPVTVQIFDFAVRSSVGEYNVYNILANFIMSLASILSFLIYTKHENIKNALIVLIGGLVLYIFFFVGLFIIMDNKWCVVICIVNEFVFIHVLVFLGQRSLASCYSWRLSGLLSLHDISSK